jgi:hypothetical protein
MCESSVFRTDKMFPHDELFWPNLGAPALVQRGKAQDLETPSDRPQSIVTTFTSLKHMPLVNAPPSVTITSQ